MPLEIKEMILEISVSEEKGFSETTEKIGQETVKDYIEQVLTIIDNRKER